MTLPVRFSHHFVILPSSLLKNREFQRFFTSLGVKARDDQRMRRTGGTCQCRDTECRVRPDEERNAEIPRISTASQDRAPSASTVPK